MNWYSIDPGVKYWAWALWSETRLHSTGIYDIKAKPLHTDFAVIEKPCNQGRRVRAQLLADLSFSAGVLSARFDRTELVTYAQWAGNAPGKIIRERARASLFALEQECLPKRKTELEHVLDAVGIGLYHLRVKGLRT